MDPVIDMTRPHAARMYDYFLGGKDHFAIDRATADKAIRDWPAVRTGARANRAFMGRAVRYLAGKAGISQFLDIGTGLPSANNVHEVAQAIAPDSKVVYVDNDPLVLAHARALLASGPLGQTAYIQADLREPEAILADPATSKVLDFTRPIALMLVGVLHFIPDEYGPASILATLVDSLPSGSYLVASHITAEHDPVSIEGIARTYRAGGIAAQARSSAEFTSLVFAGLELIDPGVVLVSQWRPDDDEPRPPAAEVSTYGGVARKPSATFPGQP